MPPVKPKGRALYNLLPSFDDVSMVALDRNSKQSSRGQPDKEVHQHIHGRGVIRDIMLGLSDGVITNVAFLAGFSGAVQSIEIIRFAGISAMLAGAVSMFFGGLIAARSERDMFRADSIRESTEIETEPDEERSELKTFYLQKGLTDEESETVVSRITSDRKKWLEDLLMHELHIHETKLERPLKTAAVIGLSFLFGALIPLISYLWINMISTAILSSVASSLVFLFVVGGWKGKLSGRRFSAAGLEMLLIGAAAAAMLFLIGSLLVFD